MTVSNTPAPPEADYQLDASGLRCPLPVLRAQKRLRSMQRGEVLEVLSTDSVSWTEMPVYCEQAGHTLLHRIADEGRWRFWIRKLT
jgi:tRNA 2-thiouridine synthesizing protein A